MANYHFPIDCSTSVHSALFQPLLPSFFRHKFRQCHSALLPQSNIEQGDSSSITDCQDLFEVSDSTSIPELLQSDSGKNDIQEIVPSLQNKLLSRFTDMLSIHRDIMIEILERDARSDRLIQKVSDWIEDIKIQNSLLIMQNEILKERLGLQDEI